ncbi:MAG: phosphonate C-P lyase system protein PhnG [Pseudaminobacter sp.]|nr:phosphonate C-P lyase system protein PhnG [Pseudaminobacter sp.]
MKILSSASCDELAQGMRTVGGDRGAATLRGPETGLVMLRGRIGGAGNPFNFGEATVTRATVRIATGETGHSCVIGRDGEKARLCAIMDALWQRQETRTAVEENIIVPVRRRLEAEERERREKVAATRVDFFTMVRGDD